MEKGYKQKIKIVYTKNGIKKEGFIKIIKRKDWKKNTLTLIETPHDVFIVGTPRLFREIGYDFLRQIQFLHELGHLTDFFFSYHFLRENWATIKGFFKFKNVFDKTKKLGIKHLILFLKSNLKYTCKNSGRLRSRR